MSIHLPRFAVTVAGLASLVLGLAWTRPALACPFCNAQLKTFSDDISASDAVVVAKFAQGPAKADADVSESTFEVVKALKGGEHLGKTRQIKLLYFGSHPAGTKFLVFGVDPKKLQWSTPNAVSDRTIEYVAKLMKLPEKGPERLDFFQNYLEDEESILATDAYEVFARAPYAEVKQLGDRMHHDRLVEWIKDREVPSSRRRLYLTMLGICGRPDDVAALEAMIRSTDRQVRTALDAMVACYLILKGAEGMPLIEDLFLKDPNAEYTDTYAAIMALRFLGQETTVVPKERLLAALRYMLDRPQLADLVIPDLARWQDWSPMAKLVELFKNADEESSWVRVPVINYLRACPKPEAKKYLDELAKIDPESVKRANSFFPPAASKPAVSKSDSEAKDAGAVKSKSAPAGAKAPAADASSGGGSNGGGAKAKLDDSSAVRTPIGEVLAVAHGSAPAATAEAAPSTASATEASGDAADTQTRWSAAKPNVAQVEDVQVQTTTAARPSERRFLPGSHPPRRDRLSGAEVATGWQALAGTAGAGVFVFALLMTILRGTGGGV